MKNYLISVLVVLVVATVVIAGEDSFFNSLQTCSPYTENGQVTADGMNISVKEQILGWENDKCIYKEYVNYSGMDTCMTCRLTQRQINELVKVMRAYSTIQQYSDEKVDTSSVSKVQDNPVVKVWNKYLQDSSVCTLEMSK